MMMTTRFAAGLAMVFTGSALVGCGDDDPLEDLKNEVMCGDVCQRYADCFDKNYDVDGCTERCTEDAGDDEDQEDKLQACVSCIDDDKSCTSAVFSCTTECAGIVP